MQMRNLAQSIVALSSILTLGACGTQELVDETSSEPEPEMGSSEQELVGDCYGPASVGCSVPWFAYYISPTLNYYGNSKFESACVMHDYCYHHGNMTYGKSRATCDSEFKAAMESACSSWSWLDIVTLGGSKADCHANAKSSTTWSRSSAGNTSSTHPTTDAASIPDRRRRPSAAASRAAERSSATRTVAAAVAERAAATKGAAAGAASRLPTSPAGQARAPSVRSPFGARSCAGWRSPQAPGTAFPEALGLEPGAPATS
jgi:hypothetical protein